MSKSTVQMDSSDIVETVSCAIMQVLKHSKNFTLIKNCCAKLEVTTPTEAEKQIKNHLWTLLHLRTGIIGREHTVKKSYPVNNSDSNVTHPLVSTCLSTQPPMNPTQVNPRWVCSNSTSDNYLYDEDIYSQDCESFFIPQLGELSSVEPTDLEFHTPVFDRESERGLVPCFDSEINPSLNDCDMAIQLTSTPEERNQNCLLTTVLETPISFHPELSSKCDILRSQKSGDDDILVSWDEEISLEILELSNLDKFSSPTITDTSLHFSRPDCLNESQLLKDYIYLDIDSESDASNSSKSEKVDDSCKSSQEIMNKALLVLEKGLLHADEAETVDNKIILDESTATDGKYIMNEVIDGPSEILALNSESSALTECKFCRSLSKQCNCPKLKAFLPSSNLLSDNGSNFCLKESSMEHPNSNELDDHHQPQDESEDEILILEEVNYSENSSSKLHFFNHIGSPHSSQSKAFGTEEHSWCDDVEVITPKNSVSIDVTDSDKELQVAVMNPIPTLPNQAKKMDEPMLEECEGVPMVVSKNKKSLMDSIKCSQTTHPKENGNCVMKEKKLYKGYVGEKFSTSDEFGVGDYESYFEVRCDSEFDGDSCSNTSVDSEEMCVVSD